MSVVRRVQIEDADENLVDSQYPLSTDGDSVYVKDIDTTRSSLSAGWTGGDVTDLFNDQYTTLTNTTSNNPKTIIVEVNRSRQTTVIGLGAGTGSFSNTKVLAVDFAGVETTLLDESSDATAKTRLLISDIPVTEYTQIKVEFHTTSTVSISVLAISKAQQRIARIQGVDPDGVVQDVATTVDGFLSISDNSSGLAIAKGDVTGHSFIHKFGATPDFDTGDGEVTVWDGADDGLLGGGAMTYTYSSTADIDTISSSSGSDTVNIEVTGLDTNGDEVVQTVTLTGQTDATLTTALKRVHRMKNTGASDLVGTVYLRTNGSSQTSGVPDTANTVRAIIRIGNNQTLMALLTIPNGEPGYLRDWYAATAGASRSTNYIIRLKARESGGVFQVKHLSAISDTATSSHKHDYVEPETFSVGTDIEMTAEITAAAITGGAVAAGFDIVLVEN